MRLMSAIPVAPRSDPEVEATPTRALLGDALRASALVFLSTRALLLLVTAAVALIDRRSAWAVWDQWDTVWYLGIARHGYQWINPGHYASHFPGSTLAFFPALPGLIHGAEAAGLPGIIGGLLIANLAFLGALVYLYLLLTDTWDEETARRALVLLAVFPTAFFFAAPYTESLFLLAAAGALYHARHGPVWAAGLWLALAALTRSTAVILIAPMLLLAKPREVRAWFAIFAPAAIAWLGYLVYLYTQGIPLATLAAAQHAWHRGLALPTTGFASSLTWLLHNAIPHWPIAIENVGGLTVTVLFLLVTVRAWPELDRPMRAYCLGFWLLILCTPEWLDEYAAPFSSVDRFVLVLFPLAGWAAARLAQHRWQHRAAASALLMAVLAGVHLSGGWIG